MEEFVQNDYIIAYFHQGMKDNNKPSLQFLWNSYKELDRSFKKNLKKLYVVSKAIGTDCERVWQRVKLFQDLRLCYSLYRDFLVLNQTYETILIAN